MRIVLWDAKSPLAEPFEVGTWITETSVESYADNLERSGWQHTGDGPNGSRVFMHPDVLAMFEVIPATVSLVKG